MPLNEYRRKRSFDRTQEPKGKLKSSPGRAYLIQKHDASRLHYDLRLELDGVLKSWAVPKGPSLNPREKRLAVEVEDHPVDYGSFEGVIPQGEYGGGAVMLWDRGEWKPEGDAKQGLRAGRLKFTLHGDRLRGGWMLVRLRGDQKRGAKPNWLLIKEQDDFANEGSADVLEEYDVSVVSGRSMSEIHSGKSTGARKRSQAKAMKVRRSVTRSASARKRTVPALPSLHPQAQLATLVAAPPEGDEWLHEIKFDGYRMFARLDGRKVRWISRNGLDWSKRLKAVHEAVSGLPCDICLLDGEVVVLDEHGVSRFELLQRALSSDLPDAQLVYCVFDCLFLDRTDLRTRPLSERKVALKRLIEAQSPRSRQLVYSEHIQGHVAELQAKACQEDWEGIVSKRSDSTYQPGRSTSWVKSKCRRGQELVIGGYTDPDGARTGFGSLLMGYFLEGDFVYAGRVGTGFSGATLRQLSRRLKRLEVRTSPFAEWPHGISRRGVHWVRPQVVAQIEFSNWTRDMLLRQGAFMGLREDKSAELVTLESPKPPKSRATPSTNRANSGKRTRGNAPQVTHPERVLFPQDGVTKQGVADYYAAVSEWILPHLENRPLSLVRCPDGVHKKCFFQKHPPQGLSKQVPRIALRESSGMDTYLYVRDLAGIVSLVQFGVIELHCWNSRIDDVERPDRIVFDLDPGEDVAWSDVVSAARGLRTLLEELQLETFLKTTGGKGLHIVVPIQRRTSWKDVKSFARGVAIAMVAAAPERFTTHMSKRARSGKVFIDYLRNERGSTAIAPYSLRARETAPVSMPIVWEAIEKLSGPGQYPLANALQLLRRRRKDPWAALPTLRQTLTAGMLKKVAEL